MSSDEKTNRPTPEEERTVFRPGGNAPAQPTSIPPFTHATPRADAHIQVGDILNHIFEVRRFIARGGMGEVFEGVNITSDERVAIKVMLPSLTADPNVQAMFRKEARTLTRLNNEALVTYRVLAQEPNLGLLYIVTEYIEGPSLSDVLGKISPSVEELKRLGIRLANGLRAAHGLGAIHRDISPDNILLHDGDLERATIIDFGIAKDLDPSSKTIVGDGFAGKLNYVAPEQLGAYDRDVGPWSDIYSLGLVLLAVATGRNIDMGATLFDAVERRRLGPDLSGAPLELQSPLERMLKPNPADRFRSMTEVIVALSDPQTVADTPAPASQATVFEPIAAPPPPIEPLRPNESERMPAPQQARSRTPMLVGSAAAVLLALAGGTYFLLGENDSTPVAVPPPTLAEARPPPPVPASDPRVALNQALAAVPCSWLDIVSLQQASGQTAVALRGVAQEPARAQASVASALQTAGAGAADISFDQVTSIPPGICSVLDAFRSIRNSGGNGLSIDRVDWTMQPQEGGGKSAEVLVNLDLGPPGQGIAFFYVSETAVVEAATQGDAATPVISRAEMERFVATPPPGATVKSLGGSRYRLSGFVDQPGWSGFLMLTGREPFDLALITTSPARRDASWRQRFTTAAERGGWKAQMVWYKVVDGGAAPTAR